MTKYVCNALSIQMLTQLSRFHLDGVEITKDFFMKMTRDADSFMGHHDISDMLDLKYNRDDIFLKHGDILYIATHVSGRTKNPNEQIDIKDKPLKYYQIFVEVK